MSSSIIERPASKPIKVDVVRLEQLFLESKFFETNTDTIIKDYIYNPQKRIIAWFDHLL